jgi:hypothetical protein
MFALARSLLEFHAMVTYVSDELMRVLKNTKQWKERSEKFFKVLARARYGTSDKVRMAELAKGGVPEAFLKPIHTNDCLRALAGHAEFIWVPDHYDVLCDFVHHNVASQMVGAAHLHEGANAKSEALTMQFVEPSLIVTYQFGSEVWYYQAVNATAERAAASVKGVLDAVSACPATPFSKEELLQYTGNDHGFGAAADGTGPTESRRRH